VACVGLRGGRGDIGSRGAPLRLCVPLGRLAGPT